MNVEVSNHMQALEDDQIKALDKKFKKNKIMTTNKILKIITKNLIANKIKTIKANNKTKITNNKKVTNNLIKTRKTDKTTKASNKIRIIKTIKIIRTTRIINNKTKLQNQKKCLLKSLTKKELQLAN